ncbi:MAG: type II toxin-antitoxin system HicA family toxin [Chloroflexi bacterium]|nr:type II toxin-antitoxin system HicA family toxin [Chloroflexota bacterium]
MKLPREIGGDELAALLKKYGFEPVRQTGSHLRLTSRIMGTAHHITIPRHKPLRLGTLSSILGVIAAYLKTDRQRLIDELFG